MDLHEMANYGMIPTYEEFRDGILKLIDEGKISRKDAALVIPELRESEDERIRKCLLAHFSRYQPEEIFLHSITMGDIVAYLEKQKDEAQKQFNLGVQAGREEVMYEMEKEQKPSTPEDIAAAYQLGLAEGRGERQPAEWSEEEKGILLGCISALQNSSHWLLADKLSSLRPQPKQEWSEEDEKMRDRILEILNKYGNIPVSGGKVQLRFNKEYMWLRHLYERFSPQPHWKPSEEQMEWLESAVRLSTNKPHIHGIIVSLYEQLKKL